jgi:ribosomal protein L44E
MRDPRCLVLVGSHAYPKPGKKHPVNASDVVGGTLTLRCSRCGKAKTITWRQGPPPPDLEGFPL